MSGATAHSVEGLQGTTYEVLAAGQTDSPQVAPGVVVYLHGVGSAVGGTAPFWDTRAAPGANGQAGGQPAAWQAGCGQVIAGLDYAMMGMHVQEQRKIKVPAADGFGAQGHPQLGVAPNTDLEFTVEVLSVQPPAQQPAAQPEAQQKETANQQAEVAQDQTAG